MLGFRNPILALMFCTCLLGLGIVVGNGMILDKIERTCKATKEIKVYNKNYFCGTLTSCAVRLHRGDSVEVTNYSCTLENGVPVINLRRY